MEVPMNYKVAVIPGDGIGPEIVREARKVLDKVGQKYGHEFTYQELLMGGCSIDAYGEPLTEETLEAAKASDSVLLGAVGGNVISNTFNMMVKRCMDVCGSLAAIVVFSPVMLLMVLLIKLTSPGPLIFKQERVGLHNRPFQMYKFRSMEVQKERDEQKCWTVKNDPRVTGIGKFMRKTSIDELPQLFNVLKGDMSLVGPRPERPQFVEKFREEIPRYMVKHQVRPGMTGWAQINGYRGDTSIRKRIEYDLYYIENWTVGLDLKILFLTCFKGFINKNAY